MIIRLKSITFLLGIALLLNSCLGTEDVFDANKQLEKEVAAIDAVLASSTGTVIKDPRGIRMVITKLGTGYPAQITQSIDADYVGRLFIGNTTFDQGNVKGPLTGFIAGWQIAFTTLPAGSEATLYIPSGWAYGNSARTGIPANSTLVFTVTFKDVVETSAELTKLGTDTVAIDNYLTTNNITAVKDTTGIRYVITQVGTGNSPGWYEKLTVTYSIKFINDSKVLGPYNLSPGSTFSSRSVDYIHGMKTGLQKLKKGGKITLYIPSGLGFGTSDQKDSSGTILVPANSNIIVEIELKDIANP